MLTDVSGILASIDCAITDYGTGPDAVRCTPPVTAVTFTWDEDAETGSAMFTGVDLMAAESLQPGMTVLVDGLRHVITAKHDDADQGLAFQLEPVE